MVIRVRCPSCATGLVALSEVEWPTPTGTGRSVWVDEPVACSVGCVLSEAQVQRLVMEAYRHPVRQLPLLLLEAAG